MIKWLLFSFGILVASTTSVLAGSATQPPSLSISAAGPLATQPGSNAYNAAIAALGFSSPTQTFGQFSLNIIYAQNYGNINVDAGDSINQALAYANSIGARIVAVPAGVFPQLTAIVDPYSYIALRGGNGGATDGYTRHADGSTGYATTLYWAGPAGATSLAATQLTVAPTSNGGTGNEQYGAEVSGIVFDGRSIIGNSALLASNMGSTFNFGFINPEVSGVTTDTTFLTETNDFQHNHMDIHGYIFSGPASCLTMQGTATGTAPSGHVNNGNSSIDVGINFDCRVADGWGLVTHRTDNLFFQHFGLIKTTTPITVTTTGAAVGATVIPVTSVVGLVVGQYAFGTNAIGSGLLVGPISPGSTITAIDSVGLTVTISNPLVLTLPPETIQFQKGGAALIDGNSSQNIFQYFGGGPNGDVILLPNSRGNIFQYIDTGNAGRFPVFSPALNGVTAATGYFDDGYGHTYAKKEVNTYMGGNSGQIDTYLANIGNPDTNNTLTLINSASDQLQITTSDLTNSWAIATASGNLRIARTYGTGSINLGNGAPVTVAGLTTFTNNVIAPTPTTSDNSTSVATTAFVQANLNSSSPSGAWNFGSTVSVAGNTTLGSDTTAANLYFDGPSATAKIISWRDASTNRWTIGEDSSGNMQFFAYDSSGTYLGNPIGIISGGTPHIGFNWPLNAASFNVSGATTLTGNTTFGSWDSYTSSATLTAAGTTLGTGTPITSKFTIISTATTGQGVVLPTGNPVGGDVWVFNRSGNSIVIYPDTTSNVIESNATGAGVTVANGSDNHFVRISSTKWMQ